MVRCNSPSPPATDPLSMTLRPSFVVANQFGLGFLLIYPICQVFSTNTVTKRNSTSASA